VVIGDEYYAATAYLTREPTLTGSLVGQDISKAMIVGLIVLGIGLATVLGGVTTHNFLLNLLAQGR
jgi:hypothetical protein